jgi:Trk K+ transport system NAD-binding subunit
MSNEPHTIALSLDVKRAIATAKMAEFQRQAYRVGDIVSTGLLGHAVAADVLLDAGVSNGLVTEHGDDIIQALIAEGFESGARQ